MTLITGLCFRVVWPRQIPIMICNAAIIPVPENLVYPTRLWNRNCSHVLRTVSKCYNVTLRIILLQQLELVSDEQHRIYVYIKTAHLSIMQGNWSPDLMLLLQQSVGAILNRWANVQEQNHIYNCNVRSIATYLSVENTKKLQCIQRTAKCIPHSDPPFTKAQCLYFRYLCLWSFGRFWIVTLAPFVAE